MLLTGFINGVSMGAGVLIARFYGAQDKKSMERTVHTTVALGVAAGLLLTVVGVLFTPQILRWMGTPGDGASQLYCLFSNLFSRLGSGYPVQCGRQHRSRLATAAAR